MPRKDPSSIARLSNAPGNLGLERLASDVSRSQVTDKIQLQLTGQLRLL